MKRREVRVIGPSEHLADSRRACQRTVNMYLSRSEGAGEDRSFVLASVPGLADYLTMPAAIRGSWNAAGRWFVVAGNTLYEIAEQGATYSSRGTLLASAGDVVMHDGNNQLVIVDGVNGYTLQLNNNTFTRISDPDWRGSAWVEEMDGYFVFVAPDSDQFYLSQIDDASSLDALDFSSADAQPDKIVTHRVHKRELILFGETSTEVWINSGDPDFPFARYNSMPIAVGCVGNRAAINTIDTLVFIGRTETGQGYVYEMQGHQPVRISTQAVETALARSTDISSASMWTYHTAGAEFVAVNAPGVSTTWVYDTATRQWHERGELVDGEWDALRAEFVTHVNGNHYAIAGEKIYTLSGQSIAGTAMTRERTMPHLVEPSLEPVSYRGLELACSTGDGGTITLEISNDGGKTYGAPLARSLGATGRYMQRIRWLGLGASFDRVFRMRCTDNVDLTIYSGVIDA